MLPMGINTFGTRQKSPNICITACLTVSYLNKESANFNALYCCNKTTFGILYDESREVALVKTRRLSNQYLIRRLS